MYAATSTKVKDKVDMSPMNTLMSIPQNVNFWLILGSSISSILRILKQLQKVLVISFLFMRTVFVKRYTIKCVLRAEAQHWRLRSAFGWV